MTNFSFTNQIMSQSPSGFLGQFNSYWSNSLTELSELVIDPTQLTSGNHLRPLLLAWGYCMPVPCNEAIDFDHILDVACAVEAIHKASIIVDDIIDEDNARRGIPAFHVTNGTDKAIVSAVYLLAFSAEKLKAAQTNVGLDILFSIYSETIKNMSLGALREENASHNQSDLLSIRQIIDMETSILIKNSFYIGYLYGMQKHGLSSSEKMKSLILNIGDKCGYIFQILNDMEPFWGINKNKLYKGNANLDITKSRKNIAMAYLFEKLSLKERETLLTAIDDHDFDKIMFLLESHHIAECILTEVQTLRGCIYQWIEEITLTLHNETWAEEFQNFFNLLITTCLERFDSEITSTGIL